MKSATSYTSLRLIAVLLFFITGTVFGAGTSKNYRTLLPMVSAAFNSINETTEMLNTGLTGLGNESTVSNCEARIAAILMLPSLDGIDKSKPVRYFLLSQDPPTTLPEPSAIIPLIPGSAGNVIASLKNRYGIVEGGSIKICAEPKDGKSPEPLYIAIAENTAMISLNIDAIKWMALNLSANTVPPVPDFRKTPVNITANGPLLGLFMELIASLDEDSVSEEATAGNTLLHIRELGSLFSSFSTIDIAVNASTLQWSVALKLNSLNNSDFSLGLKAITPADDQFMKFFPPFTGNRSVSSISGFISALPASNRKWIASLAENTRMLGFGIVPAAFDLDESIRPHLSGSGSSMFVTDKPNDQIGSVKIFSLKSSFIVQNKLKSYFGENGKSKSNLRISNFRTRSINGITVFAYDSVANKAKGQASGVNHTSEAISYVLDLNHVEIAIKENYLIIARGRSGFIDKWIVSDKISPWEEKASQLTASFDPPLENETVLGGGQIEPVSLVKKMTEFIPNLQFLSSQIPHAGDGIDWRLMRGNNAAIFDITLSNSELLACNLMRGMDSSAMQEFLGQIVLQNFQRTTAEEIRQEQLKEKLQELREK